MRYMMRALLLGAVLGCSAPAPTPGPSASDDLLSHAWAQMSSAEAIQRLGPPHSCADVDETRVCTWVKGRARMVERGGVWQTLQRSSVTITFVEDRMVGYQLRGAWE